MKKIMIRWYQLRCQYYLKRKKKALDMCHVYVNNDISKYDKCMKRVDHYTSLYRKISLKVEKLIYGKDSE